MTLLHYADYPAGLTLSHTDTYVAWTLPVLVAEFAKNTETLSAEWHPVRPAEKYCKLPRMLILTKHG